MLHWSFHSVAFPLLKNLRVGISPFPFHICDAGFTVGTEFFRGLDPVILMMNECGAAAQDAASIREAASMKEPLKETDSGSESPAEMAVDERASHSREQAFSLPGITLRAAADSCD